MGTTVDPPDHLDAFVRAVRIACDRLGDPVERRSVVRALLERVLAEQPEDRPLVAASGSWRAR